MHSFVTTAFIEMLSFAVGAIALAEMKEKWGCGLRLETSIANKGSFWKRQVQITRTANNGWSAKRSWVMRYAVTVRLR